MRVKCQIEIVNRNVASHGMRGGSGKFAQASLFLARKPGDLVFLIFCTVKDKQGVKYKVKKNVDKIFGKFVDEGKCTIRMIEPTVDICIKKANPIDLKRLLNALKLANTGQSLSGHGILSSMEPAKAKEIEKPKLKLVISARKDYPTTTSFPLSLERLEVHDCNLARVDTRMFKLKRLTTLDLSSNRIKSIPLELLDMQSLCDLNISDNEVSEFPTPVIGQSLSCYKNLRSLNLSRNKIERLPPNFHRFTELWQLDVGRNLLNQLPKEIGTLQNLRRFDASHNSITKLPNSFMNLTLDKLDLFGNPFVVGQESLVLSPSVFNEVASLQDLAAKIIRKNELFYDDRELFPWFIIHYLNSGKMCLCSGYCFHSYLSFTREVDLQQFCTNSVSIDERGRTSIPIDGVICSKKCLQLFARGNGRTR